jgi:hypothetical protein
MLYMLNAWKGSPLNKVILVEKDDWIGKDWVKHSWNNTFKRYYDKFAGLHGESSYANDDLMSDAFAEKWTSWMTHTGMKKAAKACLSSRQGWWFNMSKSWGWMLKEVANEIKAIKDADDDYWWYWIEGKKVALKLILKWLCSGLLDAHSWQNSWLDSIFTDPDSPINLIFYSAGIQNLKKIRDAKIGFSDLANEDSPNYEKANKIIDEYVSEILRESSPVWDTKSDVQFNVSDAIRNAKSSNDESYKQRA